jgi:hypothetical protein
MPTGRASNEAAEGLCMPKKGVPLLSHAHSHPPQHCAVWIKIKQDGTARSILQSIRSRMQAEKMHRALENLKIWPCK